MVMDGIVLHNYGFSLIPPPAQKEFITHMNDWYGFMVEEGLVPYIRNEMLTQEPLVHDVFGDFFYEVRQYTYAIGKDNIEFPKGEFPINSQKFIDYSFDEEQVYYDIHWVIEFSFFNDMKKYLNANRMFYKDSYSSESSWPEPKSKYYNIPICEVW
jgi:hypothetical protein